MTIRLGCKRVPDIPSVIIVVKAFHTCRIKLGGGALGRVSLPSPVFNCAPAVRIKSNVSAGCPVLNITGNMEVALTWPQFIQ